MDYSKIVDSIKKQAGNNKAVVFVSGGIDSAVTAQLTKKALGNAVYYFIDNGLQRKGEKTRVKKLFKRIGIQVKTVNAEKEFLNKISNCISGTEKRDLIGELLFEKAIQAAKHENAKHLIFGTIKNDLMVCKENEKQIPGFFLIEPLRDLTKDQVIDIAKKLSSPEKLFFKQHFPGVGFAVRIEGKVSIKKLFLIRELTNTVEKKVEEMNLHKKLWAYFPFLLSTKTDRKFVVVLRLVESVLGVMAEIPEINQRKLIELRDEIFRSHSEIGRVYFDLTPKPVSLIEFM